MAFSLKVLIATLALSSILSVSVFAKQILSDDPLVKSWLEEQKGGSTGKLAETFVDIKHGRVKGQTFKAVGGSTIYAYLGIPYAKPPIGDLRFEPPQPFDEGYQFPGGMFDGSIQPNSCGQTLTNTTTASEDCLVISVYTKKGENNTNVGPLPVMYWIHGGGFLLGQTSYYTATKLLAEDVVFVSVQYRLGPLGFLTTGDEVVPGNNGMKDMVQGLKWVQENIAAFGGDPNQVTVFGESAGAAASTFMLISPLAKGLFHQIIAMSGTAIAEWSMDRDGRGATERLCVEVGCPTGSSQEIVDCLRTLDWKVISRAHFEMLLNAQADQLRALLSGTSPVVEIDHPGAFISKEPLALMEEGDVENVPVMIGTVQHEGSFLLGAAYILKFSQTGQLDDPTYVHDKLIGDLLATWNVDETKNGASISQGLAVGFLEPGVDRSNFTEITYGLMDMITSLFMKAPTLRTAEILTRRGLPVHLYSFEYVGRSSLWNFIPLAAAIIDFVEIPAFDGGITHADDLIYMFNLPFMPTQSDQAFSRTYCEFFTNFATYKSPTPVANEWYPVWPVFSVDEPKYMVLNGTPNVQPDYTQSWRQGIDRWMM